ncbi:hypothetical protein BK660_26705 [Pseudomonas brassicacearum]|uniref:Restriction endonuclease type IV Mrr domain-containing protein n=1 Tax=Pseudomonas brassicacearum TaxID=930166 RepID=A0A423HRZ8_9PSED|nr:hypothetical protein [Pseudomonas brassicacearum]RON15937.1 hypothetical protein BK660_26705 [Pseudomonas brassicacearum]
MAAKNKDFPWMSHSREYQFFEDRMHSHSKVSAVSKVNGGLYDITLKNGQKLRTFICECYSYGLAEYYESVQNLGQLDIIVINSNWCGYSMEAKLHCQEIKVGLFDIRGLMAALNQPKHWEYLTQYERENLNN